MIKRSCLILMGLLAFGTAGAKDYLISTSKTSLLITASPGEKSKIQYYGVRICQDDVQGIYYAGLAFEADSYPVFGLNTMYEKAMAVTHSDGNMSLDLAVEVINQYADEEGEITEVVMKDKVYPFVVRQYFKAYNDTDIISTWVETENMGKKPVTIYKFASAFIPVRRGDNWLTHFHGFWGAECTMDEEQLTNGLKVISDKDGAINSESNNPSLILSLDGKPGEEYGHVIGGTLAWTGNYLIKADAKNTGLNLIAGINEENSHYILEPKETFRTPEFAMAYSTEGKGGVSRAFHRWARKYKLNRADREHDILLNSWEGVYFKVNQEVMDGMMADIASLGGELFVMDDGWFGGKYPRDAGTSSLGDWSVNREKLPEGIEGLLASARKYGIKFGIWIEPEMTNTVSELYEKHPDWVLKFDNRPATTGRGGTQLVLDMTNPEVQDFVFGVVDNLMTAHPDIAYMKWDANAYLMDYASPYLPRNKQSHIYIDYQKGLNNVLERIRAKYPELVLQACAGGGGRVNYGMLPYFDEFWTSDNTDALQRIYMQWGVSNFYPAIAMGSHVSADRNHQTGRRTPLKFRFDVAMSGRLGMEMQPAEMTDVDKEFARRAISAYKEVRPVVQFGDLFRLVSPYDRQGLASLMYTADDKSRAVFYVYKTEHFVNQKIPNVRLAGLDPDKKYRLRDMTPAVDGKPCALDGAVISGKVLMEEGLVMSKLLKTEFASLVLELKETE